MHNLALLISGLLEIFGVYLNSRFSKFTGYKKFIGFWVIMLNFGISLLFLRYAMKAMPMSVAYAIWTGIGVLGAVFIGVIFDDEKFSLKKSIYLGLIVISVIMLKIL
ncbi:multidrug transporter [Campylobacter sp. FMV-PI01]|uniref:Guanidinium exporter n=1 Tax=Campylobacter portucalensis TaxID=2608384 RepID=A0A6L5WGL0_9BACT|nr:SMR family transporter [Campylobacter portucalensis]MSN96174.1 multidrug transporter [Campylobacter portucalensis]